MAKVSKYHVLTPIHHLIASEHFWGGVIDGFACTHNLLSGYQKISLQFREDSMNQAWVEVGRLLTDSMAVAEHNYGETADVSADQGDRRSLPRGRSSRRERRERAYAR